MKVFFDTNVYVAEALQGPAAVQMLQATVRASWRIFASAYVLEEFDHVVRAQLGFSRRLSFVSQRRIVRRAKMVDPVTSRHEVVEDIKDSQILRSSLEAGVDYLVTNDVHLLSLHPYEGLKIISLTDYYQLLVTEGFLL